MALIFTRVFFWIILAILAVLLILIARRKHLRWLPALLMRFIILAFLLAVIFTPVGNLVSGETSALQVMLVDQSDSLSLESRFSAQQQAQAWNQVGGNNILFAFGDKPYAIDTDDSDWPQIDGRASNLSGALEIADGLLASSPGELVIATDGLVDDPEKISILINEIAARGHVIDLVSLSPRSDPGDGYIEDIILPGVVWQNIPSDVLVRVHSPANGSISNLDIEINGAPAADLAVEQVDDGLFRFKMPPQNPGITTLAVSANVPGDPFLENNHYYAAVQVYALPRILIVSNALETALPFSNMLTNAGLQVDMIFPQDLPDSGQGLEAYKVVFMHNILATQVNTAQKEALRSFTVNLAGGLIFLGGESSYSMGGYQNTLFEPMLPVKLEPPPRSQRSPVLFVLVLDVSGSMGQAEKGAIEPIDIEREAAMRVIESLKASDHIGVLTYEQYNHWKVRIRELGDGLSMREALDAVSTIQAYGGTNMYAATSKAVKEMIDLIPSTPDTRHILLLSDGESQDGSPEAFRETAQQAQQNGITISTIALGVEADPEMMSLIADEGKGRFYAVQDPADLPRIMLDESQAGIGENKQSGDTSLQSGVEQHPVLYALQGDQLPIIHTYNAISSKAEQGAEDILVSTSFEDPILSAWQYGLGRVITWMSDIGEEWSGPWPSGEYEQQFWTQVIQYALPSPTHGAAQVITQVSDTNLEVRAILQDGDGNPVNLSDVIFTYTDNNGEKIAYQLPQVGAGEYTVKLNRPQEGAYRAVLTYQNSTGESNEVAAPFAVNVPFDWQHIDPEVGLNNIETWSEQSGAGRSFETVAAADGGNPVSNLIQNKGIQWWLLLILIISWPVEILIRRRWLPWT